MALAHSMKHTVMAAIFALVFVSAGPLHVSAQTAGSANFVPSFAKLSDTAISQFKANPSTLLMTYASAGLPLSTQVRSLVLTDPTLVDTLIALAKCADASQKADNAGGSPKCANDAQKAAMGAGLAEAARILAATNPTLAAQIQTAVAQSGLQPLITAFIAGSNATVTAATGGGEGGAAGGGGGTSGLGATSGSNSGSNPGSVSFGSANTASAFGSLGGTSGGGLTSSTGQSTSPSKSSI